MLVGDRLDPRYLWACSWRSSAAGARGVRARTTLLLVYVFATCLGIGFGGGVVCLMTVLGNYFGLKAFALLYGIAIAINTTLARWLRRSPAVCSIMATDTGHLLTSSPAWCFLGALVLFLIRPVLPTVPVTVPA